MKILKFIKDHILLTRDPDSKQTLLREKLLFEQRQKEIEQRQLRALRRAGVSASFNEFDDEFQRLISEHHNDKHEHRP
jgi:hypothetical protein